MSWTLTLSLILPSIVFVAFMHQTIQKIKKKAFVYPSEAVIDQTLPPEILEEVLMNSDYKMLLTCAQVSKYWCHHASKKPLRQMVFNKIGKPRATVAEMAPDVKIGQEFDFSTIKWLEYPKDYPGQWHIEDKLIANRLGRLVVDADSASLVRFKVALGAPAYGPYNNPGNASKYLAKLRLEASHQNDKDWLFRNNDSNYFTVPKETIPSHWKWSAGSTVEIIVDLAYIQQHYSQFPCFYSYRIMDSSPKLAGFIRLNTNLLYILFFWYAPCVLVDYWASTSQNKYWVDLLVSFMGAAGQVFIGSIVVVENTSATTKKKAAGIMVPLLVLTITFLFFFSNTAREVFFMNALVAGCFIYAGLVSDYWKKTAFEFRLFVLFVAYCLVLTMNDWRLTVDAFKSGAVWLTLLKNLFLYGFVVLYAIIINFLRHCATEFKLDVGALIRWEKSTVEFLAWNAISVIFITLYAPLTLRIFPSS